MKTEITQVSTPTHTPLPWSVSAVPMSKTLYPSVVIVGEDGRALETVAHLSGESVYANSALIVKAVNSHAELVHALRVIATQSIGADWTPEQALVFIKDLARAAIAKAE